MNLKRQVWLPAVALSVVGGLFALTRVSDLDASVITRDSALLAQGSPLAGAVQYVGIVLWVATSAVALFASRHTQTRQHALSLVHIGILTGWLALDDLFQFHEAVGPELLGIPERATEVFYVAIALLLIVIHRQVFTSIAPIAAVLAASGLSLFVAGDFLGLGMPIEAAKILGISALANFVLILADRSIDGDN